MRTPGGHQRVGGHWRNPAQARGCVDICRAGRAGARVSEDDGLVCVYVLFPAALCKRFGKWLRPCWVWCGGAFWRLCERFEEPRWGGVVGRGYHTIGSYVISDLDSRLNGVHGCGNAASMSTTDCGAL